MGKVRLTLCGQGSCMMIREGRSNQTSGLLVSIDTFIYSSNRYALLLHYAVTVDGALYELVFNLSDQSWTLHKQETE
jgi:hypothetical protein